MAALDLALADPAYRSPVRARLPVSLRAEPGQGAVALGHLGQRHRGSLVARRLDAVLLGRGELRQLRRDLRVARRRPRVSHPGLAGDPPEPSPRPGPTRARAP